MKKRKLQSLLCAALLVASAAALFGCGPKEESMKERPLRHYPSSFTFETESAPHTVEYTDSAGRKISLYGQLFAPKEEGKYPAVLLSHGYNGHNTDFPSECQRFAERGYVCYAFDFCGAQAGGKSVGRLSNEYTPFTMKEDLCAAVAQIKTLENVDASQIFLFGGSQGGLVTALAAAELKDVAAIAMYFPAFNIPDDWRSSPVVDSSPPGMGYVIGAEYIRSVRELDPFTVIGAYPNDVCIVWGDQDAIVRREYIDRAVAAYGENRVELTVIPGAGHGFGGSALTTGVETVLKFLEAHTYA